MDDSGTGRTGHDGTQPPPPPPVFPDPLAGLVTGEQPYRAPDQVVPVVVPPPAPDPEGVAPPRATARRSAPPRPVQHVQGQPAVPGSRARPAPRQAQQPVVPPTAPPGPKKGKAGLIGCLVVLAALSGLLFNVVREIIEAVVDLLR
ncbi:hypothetical protein FHX81_3986 [Saccharothrix saharensis]|uniref:Uncharacterized protein n=1 Tax=Saccharothrix saharensis TaxID=571190 RepID=A0A543JFJ5_9PSEU|nr:hypothetical protein [Saccharothrix saharensis]TQM81617.1 hypothetical protein FHX81_3986 [Saccharothrix saharensis]